MSIKPDCYGPDVAQAFEDPSVVQAYQYRPSYPREVFDLLQGLIVDQPTHVLDVACGTGMLARPLAERVERIDAIDSSREMIEQGQRERGGEHPHLRWVVGRVEEASLWPPYALIVVGDALHWLDWERVMPRFAGMLTAQGHLAILYLGTEQTSWDDEVSHLIPRYSTIKNFQGINVIATLEEHGFFQTVGRSETTPVSWVQPLEEYIESWHARASCSRERMSPDDALAFDAAIRALVEPYSHDGCVELSIVAEMIWGKPLSGKSVS